MSASGAMNAFASVVSSGAGPKVTVWLSAVFVDIANVTVLPTLTVLDAGENRNSVLVEESTPMRTKLPLGAAFLASFFRRATSRAIWRLTALRSARADGTERLRL